MNELRNQAFIDSLNIDFEMPKHVGIIMDGNGRWAKSRNKPRVAGHRAGMDRLHGIVETSSDIGLEVLTLYAFSTENWKRPVFEVDALMGLLIEYFTKEIDELNRKGVIMHVSGDLAGFPSNVRQTLINGMTLTKNNKGMILNLALNYGSRAEIVLAVKAIAEDVMAGKMTVNDINDKAISDRLYTGGMPDPDLIIRTSGEQRLSNFMMFQAAYAELIFVDECWPDFSNELLVKTLFEYGHRDRRFGGV